MGFYDLDKDSRASLVAEIQNALFVDTSNGVLESYQTYFSDEDTYIRKSAYLAVGRIYHSDVLLRVGVHTSLNSLFSSTNAKIRQTVVNAAGEIGIHDFEIVQHFFDKGLFDEHHSVRNAVIGSMKKMGQKNPHPVINWSQKYLHHPDKEIRREICHGIELRGRTHPEDILPLLEQLQNDATKRVRWTLVHVIGQIAYKRGCLEKVTQTIRHWENQKLVADAFEEIVDVHHRYRNFSYYTQAEAIEYLKAQGVVS